VRPYGSSGHSLYRFESHYPSSNCRFTPQDFRFTTNGNALFVTAMAWSGDGTFTVHSLNTSSGDGRRVTGVTLLGSNATVKFSVEANGMRLGPVAKPTNVQNAFVFRLHLDNSAVGFVAWDLPDERTPTIVAGGVCHLRWMSGGRGDELVAIELWTGVEWHVVESAVLNTGTYTWIVPEDLPSGEPTLRIRIVDEPFLQHVASFPKQH
jgi:hypothetical protein